MSEQLEQLFSQLDEPIRGYPNVLIEALERTRA